MSMNSKFMAKRVAKALNAKTCVLDKDGVTLRGVTGNGLRFVGYWDGAGYFIEYPDHPDGLLT